MSTSYTNVGIILVPDNCNILDEQKAQYLLVENYSVSALDIIGTKDDKVIERKIA